MRKEDLDLLQNIEKIQHQQGYLLQSCKTEQQQFLHIFAQRHLVSNKILHKNIQQTLHYLKGTFAHLQLSLKYVKLCIRDNVQLDPDNSPIIKFLINWTQHYPRLKNEKSLSLTKQILQIKEANSFQSMEEYIVYLNIIGPDIMNIVCRSKQQGKSLTHPSSKSTDKWSYDHFTPSNLLSFVNYSLPKILINILLPNQMIPPQFKQQIKIIECLYKNASLQYFIRTNNQYGSLIKGLIKILLNFEWKQTEQKILMDIVFRYYYAFHHDQKYSAATIFVETYNKLSQQTICNFSDQFVLFFRIIRKIGKSKFADFILEKSKLLSSIVNQKTNQIDKIGEFKDSINPFNLPGLAEDITIGNGKTEVRTFQALQDHSLIYFKIVLASLDVTIRLYYLGDITKSNPDKNLILQRIKKEGTLSTNIIAVRKGLYMFEFDNSYSWMNSKTIKYQNVVLSPLEIQTADRYKWIDSYYGGIKPIQIANKKEIWLIRKQQAEGKYDATANITKSYIYLNMKIVFQKQVYQFQSEDENLFMLKFNEVNSNNKIRWTIADKPIKDFTSVQMFVFNKKPAVYAQNRVIKNKQTIDLKYQQSEEDVAKQT